VAIQYIEKLFNAEDARRSFPKDKSDHGLTVAPPRLDSGIYERVINNPFSSYTVPAGNCLVLRGSCVLIVIKYYYGFVSSCAMHCWAAWWPGESRVLCMIDAATARTIGTRSIRVHATNIIGIGAVQLVQSLLPAMEQIDNYELRTVYLPARGALATYGPVRSSTNLVRRKRYLPNAISRILECTLFARRFEGEGRLLVLGDIPLRCKGRQTVFVQTPLLTTGTSSYRKFGAIKYFIARSLFRLNADFASAFIVQTEAMKNALSDTYPEISARIHVIGQPAPGWLLAAGLKRTGVKPQNTPGLRLFFPAAGYPHKNHRLLSRVESGQGHAWPVSSVTLTLEEDLHPSPKSAWIKCVGRLKPEEVLGVYGTVDGLLFLSLSESFGFPLVEAMWIGLPIICPDLPYSRVLCGDEAIYFDPENVSSLQAAAIELDKRLKAGWWPDWREPMKAIPESWGAVAASMLRVTAGQDAAN
jgi:hypothetical protein